VFPPPATFRSFHPLTGRESQRLFTAATPAEVDAGALLAWNAFCQGAPRERRALFLEAAANALESDAANLIPIVIEETALTPRRLEAELARTASTLRLFAALTRNPSWVEATIDHADSSRHPNPKPDLRRMLIPLGPVVVFGASNFPLAYGVAGGDTASALGAGCPVLVKGHSAHPATGERIANLLSKARDLAGLSRGWFQYFPAGGDRDLAVGIELVRHPRVRAVGFTGSVAGGTALVREGASRPEPIPVFAEMGSVNPVFILPGALRQRAAHIAEQLAASATNSGGQMCTCPGLNFIPTADRTFLDAFRTAMAEKPEVVMLSPRTASNYFNRLSEIAHQPGVSVETGRTDPPGACRAVPTLFLIDFSSFRAHPTLWDECFGPETIVVRCNSDTDILDAARAMPGSLTASVFTGQGDEPLARQLLPILADRAGRVIVNGVPTGVEVAPAMVHSGPFPACSRPDSTAVGPFAIRRWCRPVCFQNTPDELLPEELREHNPLAIDRIVDGRFVAGR
jgi:alpha-ketoglutaric semialdehyde dehydrogenase